jgi:hypothetical protein
MMEDHGPTLAADGPEQTGAVGRCRSELVRHPVSAASAALTAFQFHGSNVSSSCRLVRLDTMRSSTSASHASGSTPFNFALWMSVAMIAQCRPPLSFPAIIISAEPRAHGGAPARLLRIHAHRCSIREAISITLVRPAVGSTIRPVSRGDSAATSTRTKRGVPASCRLNSSGAMYRAGLCQFHAYAIAAAEACVDRLSSTIARF